MKKITIKEIADLSGVSVATVSRVINNNGRFSEETKNKVLSIIEQTDYQMNYAAKALRMNKSFSIGIIVPDISNYFFYSIVQKIEQLMFELGYSTMICNTDRNANKEKSYLKMLQNRGVDGIIVISGGSNFEFEGHHIPYVCIDREPKDKSKTIFIASDHFQGAYMATEYLIERGAKYPLIVYFDDKSPYAKERIKGFKKTLKDYRINEFEDMFFKYDKDFPEHLIRQIKNNSKIDSIFAINDNVAMEVLLVLNEHNIDIPNDIQLIGFDNNKMDIYLNPQLSTVSQNVNMLAQKATESLLDMINGKIDLNKQITLPVELVIRETTR